MGFFSDLKEDLSQAVNELMPEEELKKEETSEKASVLKPPSHPRTRQDFGHRAASSSVHYAQQRQYLCAGY